MTAAEPTASTQLLEVRELTIRIGSVTILETISFSVAAGSLLGLIGPGGSGKSVLFDVLCGLQTPSGGHVRFDGQSIEAKAPHRIGRLGVARTFSPPAPLPGGTVLDTLVTAVAMGGSTGVLGHIAQTIGFRRSIERSALQILHTTGLAELADHPAIGLPSGYRINLEVARALASEPRLLLLDSPLQGLSQGERSAFGRLLLDLNARGIAIMLADHDLELLSTICSRVLVLERGRLIADNTPGEIGSSRDVLRAFVGEAVL